MGKLGLSIRIGLALTGFLLAANAVVAITHSRPQKKRGQFHQLFKKSGDADVGQGARAAAPEQIKVDCPLAITVKPVIPQDFDQYDVGFALGFREINVKDFGGKTNVTCTYGPAGFAGIPIGRVLPGIYKCEIYDKNANNAYAVCTKAAFPRKRP